MTSLDVKTTQNHVFPHSSGFRRVENARPNCLSLPPALSTNMGRIYATAGDHVRLLTKTDHGGKTFCACPPVLALIPSLYSTHVCIGISRCETDDKNTVPWAKLGAIVFAQAATRRNNKQHSDPHSVMRQYDTHPKPLIDPKRRSLPKEAFAQRSL